MLDSVLVGKSLLIALAIVVLCISALPYGGKYMTDDLFISLQFARNLRSDGEFSFNSGEPVYGFTTPLWIAILALGGRSENGALLAKVLSLFFAVGSVLVFSLLARRLIPRWRFASLATVVWCYDPWFSRWSISGMEISLTIFLVLLSIFFYLKERESGSVKLTPILLGAASLTRPECVLLFVAVLLDFFMLNPRTPKSTVRMVVLYLLILLPWLGYAYSSFGSIVPTTLRLKHEFPAPPRVMFSSTFLGLKIVGATYLIEICFILYYIVTAKSKLVILRNHFASWGWVIALPLFYTLGGTVQLSRYLLPVLPLLVIYGFRGLCRFFSDPKVGRLVARNLVFAAILLIFCLNSWIGWMVNYPEVLRFATTMDDSLVAIGKWLAQNTPPNSMVAIQDVGAVGYFSQRKIIDVIGLVTPPLIERWKSNGSHRILSEVLYEDVGRPDYVIDVHRSRNQLIKDCPFQGLYEPIFSRKLVGRAFPQGIHYTVYKVDWDKYPG